ncbi:Ureohydrolase [Coniophora puteana RWD-64-598 SS2]|uniref:Arginase n=1 Tax=Coniophora puteana (strain RWD-64-598) TaxID=741705 RepID=A0A5M3N0D4_CONPW|nr:Ureohydrolase [Coniophora puteana RWD-64-598 SS2]EIW84842.1 Ureohydrolase [Coniophora puteana RWD-64-598 SS2]
MSSPANKFLSSPKTVAIVGCPFGGGGIPTKAGVDKGPSHIVDAGLVTQLEELGWKVEFDGHQRFESLVPENDPPIGKLKNPRTVSAVCESVAKVVGGHARAGRLPVSLGGDHSLAMGTISGTLDAYPDACVIYVDAHTDINTVATTDSGNMHGMPVSFLMGLSSGVDAFAWLKGALRPERMVYIGLRDLDASEKRILRENSIRAFSMRDVDRHGICRVVGMALDRVNPDRDRPIHLSFDIDALDPSVAPSTVLPVQGGLTFREGHSVCDAIHETGLLVALDLVEVNPSIGDVKDVQQTVRVACSLIRTALGETLV